MSSEFVLCQIVGYHWLWFLEMQSKAIYCMYILLYYLFTNKDPLQESQVYLTILADVDISWVSVYPEA